MRIWVIALIVVVVLIIMVSIGPLLVPGNHYKVFAVSQLEKKLPFKVDIEEVKFRIMPVPAFIFKNVTLTDVQNFSGQKFVTIEKMRGDVSWLGLITKNYEFQLKINNAKVNILCNETVCNIDSLFENKEKPIIPPDQMPSMPDDIPVIPAPSGKYLENLLISTAYAAGEEYFIKSMHILDSELHYFINGIERLVVLNIDSRIDPMENGYKFMIQAGSENNPAVVVGGVISIDKHRGVLFSKSLEGYLMKIPIKAGFEYCSACNPRLQRWSVNAVTITPRQLNELIGQFDLELPLAFEWGGNLGLIVEHLPTNDLTFNLDLTPAMVVWENIYNKQPDLAQKITMKWKSGNVAGDVLLLNDKFLLAGSIKNYNVDLSGVGNDFDLMVLKSYLPVLKDLESALNPRIEVQVKGKTYSFPEQWNFEGTLSAKQLKTSFGEIDNAVVSITTEGGLNISKIEGDLWGGKISGRGEIIPSSNEYEKFDLIVTGARLEGVPISKNILMGPADINFVIEKDVTAERLEGSLASTDILTLAYIEFAYKKLDESWLKISGSKKMSEVLGGKVSNLKANFKKISKDEYYVDQIEAELGSAKIEMSGGIETVNNELLLKGKIKIPNGASIAGSGTFLITPDGVLDLPVIVSGTLDKPEWDIDFEEFNKIKAEKGQQMQKPAEKEEVKVVKKPEQKPKVVQATPQRPAVEAAPKQKPIEAPAAPQAQIRKIGQDDFFKIVIGE